MYRGNDEFIHGFGKTHFRNGRSDICGRFFCAFTCVAHCDAVSCIRDHGDIVIGITDRKGHVARYVQMICELQECFALCDTLIHENDSVAEAWLNAGLALFNQGVALDKNPVLSAKKHGQVISFYKQALPYLEKYRQLQPERKDRWALPLYTIYLNLNRGKEFDEIDKLLK